MKKQILWISILTAAASTAATAETINAAGATFPAPIYQKWFEEFHKAHADIQINYQPIGSGGGIRQITEGTVDFGASDMPMTDEQMSKVSKFKVLHFPTVLGGIVPTYNVPGVPSINFSGATLAGIYLGSIKKWNDPALVKDNPGAKLPNEDITVVHRSDGSGTSFVFSDYLAKVSPEWKTKVGVNTSVNWPVGLGGKGNEGVSGLVKQTPFSIGYVELIYAVQNKMEYGAMKNKAGNFVKADFNTVSDAAAGAAKDMPADFRVSITDAPGKNAYPIASFTWLLIPDKIDNATKKKSITDFLQWMMTAGQGDAQALSYAPLPKPVVVKEQKQLALIK
ncbi:MAG TPA: phosphate ABC transporter substrate-binding protein PstS [Bryobacteraceae bacterium]|jgi:phosphate transport system substrate-binding protein|nr:phosphate ABC transporter substrate-binding protein PstS [Bryobacteraceae bacterium]